MTTPASTMTARLRWLALPWLAAGMAAAAPLHAQQVELYRCTDASGALTIQNDVPCPVGQRQEIQVVDPPPPLPAYRGRAERMPAIVAAEEERRAAAAALALPAPVPAGERTAPPPLFQCSTWDEDTYLTEDATARERCAPLRTVGLDGNPMHGAGSACQTVRDQCQAVPEAALCATWQRRVDEAQFRWKFARTGNDDPRRFEYDRLVAILANSTCAG